MCNINTLKYTLALSNNCVTYGQILHCFCAYLRNFWKKNKDRIRVFRSVLLVRRLKVSNFCCVRRHGRARYRTVVLRGARFSLEYTRRKLGHFVPQTTILPTVHERVQSCCRKQHEVHPRNDETRMPDGTFVHAQENEHAKLRQVARERNEDYRDHGLVHSTICGLFTCSMCCHVLVDRERRIELLIKLKDIRLHSKSSLTLNECNETIARILKAHSH